MGEPDLIESPFYSFYGSYKSRRSWGVSSMHERMRYMFSVNRHSGGRRFREAVNATMLEF